MGNPKYIFVPVGFSEIGNSETPYDGSVVFEKLGLVSPPDNKVFTIKEMSNVRFFTPSVLTLPQWNDCDKVMLLPVEGTIIPNPKSKYIELFKMERYVIFFHYPNNDLAWVKVKEDLFFSDFEISCIWPTARGYHWC